jgi:hypothetical protein
LEIKTERIEGAFPSPLKAQGALALIQPDAPISTREADAILAWVKAGGHLFYVPSPEWFDAPGEILERKLGVRALSKSSPRTVPPASASSLARYVGGLYVGGNRITQRPKKSTVYYKDGDGAILISFRLGKGSVLALSDPTPLDNQNIDQEGNARLAVWVSQGKTVVFDEFHQGYQSAASEPTFWGQLGVPIHLAIFQLILVALLMGWTYSRRFGETVTPAAENRRSVGEYVISLGYLLRRAGGDRTALAIIGRSFKRELAGWVGAPADTPTDALLEASSERVDIPRDRLRDALDAADGVTPPGVKPLAACRRIAALREELNLHGRYTGSSRTRE